MGIFSSRSTDWILPVAAARGLRANVSKGLHDAGATIDGVHEGVPWRLVASAYLDREGERRQVDWYTVLQSQRRENYLDVRFRPTSGFTSDEELVVALQLAFGLGRMLYRKLRGGEASATAPINPFNRNEPKEPTFHDPGGLLDDQLRHDLSVWPTAGTNLDPVHVRPHECFYSLEYYQERSLRLRTAWWWDGPERLEHLLRVGERLISTLRPHSVVET